MVPETPPTFMVIVHASACRCCSVARVNRHHGLCKLYEDVLKELNPAVARMTYDLNDMLRYIDTLPEIIIMVPDPRTRLYTPHDRNWIKHSVTSHLQSIASRR